MDGHRIQYNVKFCDALRKCKRKTYVRRDEGMEVLKLVLLPQYIYLVIICPTTIDQSLIEEIVVNGLKKSEQHINEKVILMTSLNSRLAQQLRWDDNIFHVVEESVVFGDFTKESRKRLWWQRNVIFQGKRMSLGELFTSKTSKNYEAALKADMLEKLIGNEGIRVGTEVQCPDEPPESFHVTRILRYEEGEVEEAEIPSRREKIVLIAGGAGSGKSALFTKLAVTIKNENPHLWIIAIKLQDYIGALFKLQGKDVDAMTIAEFLGSREETKLATPFEEYVFRRDKSVILMLDGVEEAWPDYTRLILNLLAECGDAPHISKVILITRLNIAWLLEEELSVTTYTLQLFTQQKLVGFLVSYWSHPLQLEEGNKEKWEQYSGELIEEFSFSNLDVDAHVIGLPLGAKLLASRTLYLKTDEAKPKFSQRLVVELFECLIEKTISGFMGKVNPNRNMPVNQSLNQFYEKCLACHQTLAVDAVFEGNNRGQLLEHWAIDKNIEVGMLRIGFVQNYKNKLQFTYKSCAEYFVAQSLLKELRNADQNVDFLKFFLDEFLFDPKFVGVRTFFDSSLQKVTDSLPSGTFQKNHFQVQNSTSLVVHETDDRNIIHQLAAEGCAAILQVIFECIDCRTDVNAKNKDGLTALHYAAERGPLHTVKILWKQGADVNITDRQGQTPLHFAAWRGHPNIIKFLVERGVDVTIKDNDNQTALHAVAAEGHLDTVKLLVGCGADANIKNNNGQTPLHSAAANGHLSTVEYLAEQGADITIKNINGQTPLHSAAVRGHLDTVKFLVGLGVDVNIKNNEGETPLHSAALEGHLDIVRYFVESGAEVNIATNYVATPLHFAALGGHLDIVRLLVQSGADVTVTNNNSQTVLHSAVVEGHLETAKFLLERGADVNAKDVFGETPLLCAVRWNYLDTVKLLVGRGADVTMKNNHSETALHCATAESHLDTVEYLVGQGADVNMRDIFGETPLYRATRSGRLDTVRFLVAQDADTTIKNSNGQTPLHSASLRGHSAIVEFLVEQMTVENDNSETPQHCAFIECPSDATRFLIQRSANMDTKTL